ncbi:MAG: EutN/CcmL family microcompartment protein [Planctomycetes bacterium]|nr:EutN/CcmL family microcompartment protein [Planctomycetota bacterium]
MFLGRVTGRVVSTVRYPGLEGVKLLVVQPVDEHGEAIGETLVAADAVQAGPGELVFLCSGREASMALPEYFVPVDAAIVGHVEQMGLEETLDSGKKA